MKVKTIYQLTVSVLLLILISCNAKTKDPVQERLENLVIELQKKQYQEKYIDGMPYYAKVFSLNGVRYLLELDTAASLFRLNEGEMGPEKLLSTPKPLGVGKPAILLNRDINKDGKEDLIVKMPTGGTAGDQYILAFYQEDSKSFVHNDTLELMNLSFDPAQNTIESAYRWSSIKFKVVGTVLREMEEKVYLKYTSGDPKLMNSIEVTRYDSAGKVMSIDTIQIKE